MSFHRLLEIFDIVNDACKQCNFGTFSEEEKSMMEAILRLIHPFKLLTDRLQTDSEPTVSLIYPGILALIANLKVCSNNYTRKKTFEPIHLGTAGLSGSSRCFGRWLGTTICSCNCG